MGPLGNPLPDSFVRSHVGAGGRWTFAAFFRPARVGWGYPGKSLPGCKGPSEVISRHVPRRGRLLGSPGKRCVAARMSGSAVLSRQNKERSRRKGRYVNRHLWDLLSVCRRPGGRCLGSPAAEATGKTLPQTKNGKKGAVESLWRKNRVESTAEKLWKPPPVLCSLCPPNRTGHDVIGDSGPHRIRPHANGYGRTST